MGQHAGHGKPRLTSQVPGHLGLALAWRRAMLGPLEQVHHLVAGSSRSSTYRRGAPGPRARNAQATLQRPAPFDAVQRHLRNRPGAAPAAPSPRQQPASRVRAAGARGHSGRLRAWRGGNTGASRQALSRVHQHQQASGTSQACGQRHLPTCGASESGPGGDEAAATSFRPTRWQPFPKGRQQQGHSGATRGCNRRTPGAGQQGPGTARAGATFMPMPRGGGGRPPAPARGGAGKAVQWMKVVWPGLEEGITALLRPPCSAAA